MFPISDPYVQLEIHHQRAAELHRAAAAHRLAQQARGERRRLGRWSHAAARPRPVQAPVAP